MRNLFLTRPHMRGSDVAYLRKRLAAFGWPSPPLSEEKVFDEVLRGEVQGFQHMQSIPATGTVDDLTWHALLHSTPYPIGHILQKPLVSKLMREARGMVGIPFIAGSSLPPLGLDSLGFVVACFSEALRWWPKQVVASDLTASLMANDLKPWNTTGVSGDLIWYAPSREQLPNHVMLMLGELYAVGAVGGNNYTHTRELAKKRNAEVKIKPIHYRPEIVGYSPSEQVEAYLRGRLTPQ